MRIISLIDTESQNVITIDAESFMLRIEKDDNPKEVRLKAYITSILYELFNKHPQPLSYQIITKLLKEHNLIICDITRINRKLSEIRRFLSNFHPSLQNLILNTRGIGYSLPLRLKKLYYTSQTKEDNLYSSSKLIKAVEILYGLINDSIDLTAHSKVIKYTHGYIVYREDVRDAIVENIAEFNECKKIILQETRTHEADFIGLRLNYLLAKLKTYLGLARISDYPISLIQWLDWFEQEVWLLFNELKKLIREAECL